VRALFKRAGWFASGVLHGGLAVVAFELLLGWHVRGDSDTEAQEWAVLLMSQPFGRWLVAAIGAGIVVASERQPYGPWLLAAVALGFVAYGVFELVRAWSRQFREPAA
jgi:hypothetical protein